LQRPVIAEGVESIEIGLALLSLGCQYAQGFGIAKAMPKEDIESWLKEWKKDSIWGSLNYKKSQSVEYFDVDVAVFSHLIWIESIGEYIEKKGSKKPIIDSDSCQFNRWYQGIGQDRYATHEIYPFLQSLHYKMHQKGNEVIELSNKHQDKKVSIKMSELKSSANRFVEMLKLLKK
ncbi:MAG: CZB domain-containing protein, partial [Campylobacterota bacterium]|nr:CZB domain-containing protein [Campylobacterota bacterium]